MNYRINMSHIQPMFMNGSLVIMAPSYVNYRKLFKKISVTIRLFQSLGNSPRSSLSHFSLKKIIIVAWVTHRIYTSYSILAPFAPPAPSRKHRSRSRSKASKTKASRRRYLQRLSRASQHCVGVQLALRAQLYQE